MGTSKITNALLYSLAVISILGFVGIMAESWLGFDLIINNATAYMLIVLGIGLAIEGQVKKWKNFRSGGLSTTEVAHVVTGLVGLFAVGVGFLSLIGLDGPILMATKGIIAASYVIIIILQTWVID